MRSYLQILAASCVIVTLLAAQSATASTAAAKASKPDGKLIELDEDNWQLMLNGEWMIEFFAPWCPACKNLAPVWERYANTAKDVNVNVAKIDVTTSPSLSGRFFVTALPTIYHVKDGEFRQYRGARDAEALLYFLKKKSWQAIEPLSSWKKPDTIHMSLLSYFFKLSHTLKDFNARLQEEYGLPTWGSYALFAIATIFVGAALGLMLVCIVDFVYPPKKSPRQSFSESQDNLAKGVEDLATEEIEDDEDDNAAEEEDGNSDDDAEEDQEEEDEEEQETKEETGDKVQAEKKSEKINSRAADDAPEVADKPSTEQVRKRKPRKAD
ncbi:thioredoxin-related transmembrane protein 1 isoform X2 [Drosophila sulfurigaster albostrigata]|uniref:thioredoxin-related transmembrane protein 1 isoform X2 n=1 Tax=Drosophila sulfurigaster albostrigata TaxID=89887 RepID=UPI002D2197B2|nr:thioredoxin-related transmembrane protein 1 isoform X2 [Drosophila sulfurigaster albostrigata]